MEDYEQELYGVEDDFHSQFAAELEVLAELEGGCSSRSGSWSGVAARGRAGGLGSRIALQESAETLSGS